LYCTAPLDPPGEPPLGVYASNAVLPALRRTDCPAPIAMLPGMSRKSAMLSLDWYTNAYVKSRQIILRHEHFDFLIHGENI
jgi:hypothetical protein